jgi:hypothetical protein
VAWGDHARIAPACSGGDLAVAFQKHNIVTISLELVGGRDADHTAPEHYDTHEATGLLIDRRAMMARAPAGLTKISTLHLLVIK